MRIALSALSAALPAALSTALLAGATMAALAVTPAAAQGCGWYAFAGAYQSYGRAQRQANRVGGYVVNVDNSNSPNAGRGFFAVAAGPTSRSGANNARRRFQRNGVGSAYVANRCFYG